MSRNLALMFVGNMTLTLTAVLRAGIALTWFLNWRGFPNGLNTNVLMSASQRH